MIKIFYWRI